MTVFSYIDDHPDTSQTDVVQDFATRQIGALEHQVHDNPSALSSKRPQIVTWPDVERSLIIWVHAMEDKGEHVTGLMLQGKLL